MLKFMPKKRNIPLGTVNISSKAKQCVKEILNTGRLSHGKFSQDLEREFAKLHNRKFALLTNSGTSALQVAVHTLKELHKWKNGDEVIVPAITFIATSNVVLQNNLKPVFVDVDPNYYNIDPDKIEEKITKKTRAIMPVHMFGLSAEMNPILDLAKKYKLKIIEDSCEAMFVTYKGHPVGSLGDIACYSTYVAHLLVTGVGGIAVTNNPEYAVVMKSLMNHGRDSIYLNIDDDDNIADDKKLFQLVNKRFNFIRIGYSYRLTEFEAALGLAALKGKDEMMKKRKTNADYLIKGLSEFSDYLQLPTWPSYSEHAFMLFPIVINNSKIKRDNLILILEKYGVETRYMMPLINQPIYKKLFGNLEQYFPVAKWINKSGFCIPCHQDLNKTDLEHIVSVFEYAIKKLTKL